MLRIAMVEDNHDSREVLRQYIDRYFSESGRAVSVDGFGSGEEFLAAFQPVYKLLFLDIQMAGIDGMTVAEKVRESDSEVQIIFITNMVQYAVRGYAVKAIDYILKPVNYFAFSEHMKKAERYLPKEEGEYLFLNVGGGMKKVDISLIFYFESVGHYLDIYMEDGKVTVAGTLKNMEKELAGRGFFRCNNCYLVNLARVVGVNKNLLTVGGYEILISRPKKKAFMEALTDFVGGVG